MALTPGTKLGPYEIVGPLGAGGMGEVYCARDSRLARQVAIKVLPAAFSRDPDRLRRFEQEARATAALNHPNILAVFDIGSHQDSQYVVTELLEGETLRQRIQSGPLSTRRATNYALQMAKGLSAAHEQGITHRDLKPENIFLTKDGRIKILDFGLAKVSQSARTAPASDTPTLASQTEPGMVLGTVGYMAPEQVRGKPADARSDIFGLGAILFEMVTGKRAFQGETAADTMSAILKTDPPPLTDSQPNCPPGLGRIVEHCLEKDPDNRFQSARDVAFSLEAFSESSTGSAPALRLAARPNWRNRSLLAGLGIGLMIAIATFVIARRTAPQPPPAFFQELTFQRGSIQAARFAPDGETVVYAAAWAGKPMELFSMRTQGTESRDLGMTDTDLLGVSSTGEMAVRLHPMYSGPYSIAGTLARTMLAGGTPRPVESDIEFADWSPDGRLAVVRRVGGRTRLEFPVGKVLYENAGWIGNPRVSPDGKYVGFIDHPSRIGDPGDIFVTDLSGHARDLSHGFVSAQGLAWSSSGDEIWFSATRVGGARALYAVSLAGKERVVTHIPGIFNLCDISRTGRVLLTRDDWRVGIIALQPGSSHEQDLSWMDFSAIRDLSGDGKLLLFDESGEAGGASGAIYLRKMDGTPPVKLSDGISNSLSSDGKWVLGLSGQELHDLTFFPTGTGEPESTTLPGLSYHWGNWLLNQRRIMFAANEPGKASRIYVMDVPHGQPHPITPEGVSLVNHTHFLSPDGTLFLSVEADGSSAIRSVQNGDLKSIPGLSSGEIAFGFTGDGKSVYVYRPSVPAHIYQVDLASGRRQLWKDLVPPQPDGVNFIRPPHIAADGKTYAYNYNRVLSTLYVADGLR